jgi:simple sugar transport system ATP-binding protein
MPLDPRRRVRDLSVGEQQRVEILKALRRDVELLILDEPTAVLTPQEVERLFKGVRRLISENRTVIFIAHKLEEVLAIANEITVMRKGQVVGHRNSEGVTKSDLIHLMVGESFTLGQRRYGAESGPERLVIRDLAFHNARGHSELDGVTLSVHAGEIVGVAGVEGNGQQALEQVLGGLANPTGGEVLLDGKAIGRASPARRRAAGLAYVPADRLEWGCAPNASVFENAITQSYRSESRAGVMNRARLKSLVRGMFERFDVRAPSLETAISSLSGGNIQKLILARELGDERGSELAAIIISSPSRGIDIRGVEFIHDLLSQYRAAGCAVLLISTDLDEILALSDRIAVLYAGRLVAMLPGRGGASKAELGQYMLQGGDRRATA